MGSKLNSITCHRCGSMAIETIYGNSQLGYLCANPACRCKFSINEMSADNKNEQKAKAKFLARAREITENKKCKILISNIKKIRVSTRLGQQEFSEFLGVTGQRYGNIERCENTPIATILSDLQELFDVSWDDLYTTVYITKEQYNKLIDMVEVSENVFEIDPKLKELRENLAKKEVQFGITERRVYENTKLPDSEDVKEKKKILQELYKEYTDYQKKSGCILKRGVIIDYYNYELLKTMDGFRDLP